MPGRNRTAKPKPAVAVPGLLAAGLAHHQAGRLVEAGRLYGEILKLAPRHVDALHLSGVIAFQSGRLPEALERYRQALRVKPDFPEAFYNLGVALQGQGQPAGAIESYRQALALKPDYPQALNNLGLALKEQGLLGEAVGSYRQALALKPDYPQALNNLGLALKEQGLLREAVGSYRQALGLKPDYPQALSNLGVALQDLGLLGEAVGSYRQALGLKPDYPEALSNLGYALHQQGHSSAAVESLRQALGLKPDYPQALNNLGLALQQLGRPDEAVDSYRQALGLKPDSPEVLNNLAAALQDLGRLNEAIECCKQALALKPGDPDALNNLGNALLDQGRAREAVTCYRQALGLKPDHHVAHTNLIFAQNFLPEMNTAEQQRERRNWDASHARPLARGPEPAPVEEAGGRIRVGYVSAFFRHQAATYAFAPVLLHHDPERFEVVCYSDTVREDDLTARLRGAASLWRPTVGLGDDRLASLVRDDGIGILVDCVGHMRGNRLGVFARKPAPIQISAWGEPTGTGLAAMDGLFGDAVLIPPGERPLFAETVIDLPCFLTWWTPDPLPEPDAPPALSLGRVVFGSFNRAAKLTDETLALWAGVLAAVPGATLLLKDRLWSFPEQQAALSRRFADRGCDPGRLMFLGGTSREAHFAAYRSIDIALDPLPHGGGMTTLDALWMGVPVVTLPGASPSSRLAAAVLSALDLPQWIADSPPDYVARAAGLAADLSGLGCARGTLRDRMRAHPAGDPVRYTRAVEAAYRDLWQRRHDRRAGTGPGSRA